MSKEMVNHPSHYNQSPIETIDMMVSIFGKEYTRMWCVMTAFKYRMRLGHKDDINQDLAKEQWYLNKAKELEKWQTCSSVESFGRYTMQHYCVPGISPIRVEQDQPRPNLPCSSCIFSSQGWTRQETSPL